MTLVSERNCTGVSERRKSGTAPGWIPAPEAKALFLAGSADSTLICFSTSQLATSFVPPYRPGAEPLTLRVTVAPPCVGPVGPVGPVGLVGSVGPVGATVRVLSGTGTGGVTVCVGWISCAVVSAAVDSVNGSGPCAEVVWRKTSPWLPEGPEGRVRTTASVMAAATATNAVTSRGTDRHQCG